MSNWILNNRGVLKIIDLSAYPGLNYSPAVLTIADNEGSPITNLDYAYVAELSRAWKVNYSVAKTLGGDLYYTTFGDDNVPLSLGGFIFEPDGSGAHAYVKMQNFFNNCKATTHNPPVLTVTIDGKAQKCLLVEAALSYAIGNSDATLFRFKMIMLILN